MPVKIKKLEWNNAKDCSVEKGWHDNEDALVAGYGEHQYRIDIKGSRVWFNSDNYLITIGYHVKDIDAAKGYCQEHFEESVRECLDV